MRSLATDAILARLPELHDELVAGGAPRSAAAKYLVGWTAGGVASAVGREHAVSARGLLLDPASVRFRVHEGGWVELAHADVSGSGSAATVVEALVAAVTPLVEACSALARVGRRSLWSEVADSLGMALTHPDAAGLAPDPDAVRRAEELVRVPGAPWRSLPSIGVVQTARGPAYVGQKGGCCLAYLTPDVDLPDTGTLDATYQAFLERFPPQRPAYCATCCFRTAEDARARQVAWHELSS